MLSSQAPEPAGYAAAVICTDRGQHARARIASLTAAPDAGQDPSQLWVQYEQGAVAGTWMGADGWRTYRFTCPRCGRNVPLREPKAITVVAVLRHADDVGVPPALDISALPC